MLSFEPLCGGGDSVQSFPNILFIKDSIFTCKYKSHCIDHIYGITQFSLQNKAAGVLCLTFDSTKLRET